MPAAATDLVARFFALVGAVHADFDDVLTDDFVVHAPGNVSIDGRAYLAALATAFPGSTTAVEEMIVQGDRAGARVRMAGIHRGVFRGVAPTGAAVNVTATHLLRVADGKIAELWDGMDTMGLMDQIGIDHVNG